MSAREEIEERRAKRKAALEEAREDQAVKDLEAYDALEQEHGDGNVVSLSVERYVSGFPTIVVLRAPGQGHYKRFVDMVHRAADKQSATDRRKAQDTLADSCWIYPAKEEDRKAMLAEFPGLLVSIAIRANKLVEGKAEEEGKG